MQYDNQYWLEHQLDITEAVMTVYEGNDIWGLPKCGCPAPPNPFRIYAAEYQGKRLEQIKTVMQERFTSWARVAG